ncbi:acetyltransferase [Sphaerisporangium rufum]|uniref:Lysine N-acyltransferase MbtK n=1 Tax=Sphaerisporangium rufum TaxID=1381558 RepID=A0A919R6M1_9ACTN|nr:GNAT family N-acetyltransferase [Sphaerisporangium rufum]GII80464.1 acetyltransferase [Sphaerisporangium rufum]
MTAEFPHVQVIDGFGTVRIDPLRVPEDIEVVHRWVNQERARFWGMLGLDQEQVAEIYTHLDALPTHHAYLVRRDGRPVALFQTYRPDADPVGECYDVQPGDMGVHLMIGPPEDGPEPGFTGHLLGAFLRFVLADPATRRIVAEPDAQNAKVIDRLLRTGFTLGPEIHLAEKRARLAFLDRDAITE